MACCCCLSLSINVKLLLLLLLLLQRVVQQYGFEFDEMVECDEEGKLQLDSSSSSSSSSSKKQGDDPGIWCNDNRARVQ